jgi:hypothetical protein
MPGIKIKFSGDATQLKQTTDKVKKDVGGMGKEIKGMLGAAFAGFSVGAAVAGVKSLVDEFSRIQDLANRLGTDAETLQRIGRLASLAGADVETLARALTKMQAALGGTDAAGKKARESLAGLGIDAQAFIAAGLDGKIYMLADAYEKSGGEGKAFSDILDLMGVKAADLIPLFQQGGSALRQMGEEMAVVSNDQVAALEAMGVAWENLAANIKATVAGPIADSLQFLSALMDEIKDEGTNVNLDGVARRLANGGKLVRPMAESAPITVESEAGRKNREFLENASALAKQTADILGDDYIKSLDRMGYGIGSNSGDRAAREARMEAMERLGKKQSTLEDLQAARDGFIPGRDKAALGPTTTAGDLISSLAREGGASGQTGGIVVDQLRVAEDSRNILAKIERNTSKPATAASASWS